MYSRYNLDLDYKIPAQARGRSQKLTVSLNTVIKNIVFSNLIEILQGDRNKFLSMDYRELSVIAKSCGIIDERGNGTEYVILYSKQVQKVFIKNKAATDEGLGPEIASKSSTVCSR